MSNQSGLQTTEPSGASCTSDQNELPSKQYISILSPTSTEILMKWKATETDRKAKLYNVKYRPTTDKPFQSLEIDMEEVRLVDLKSKTEYEVKVSWVDEKENEHFMFRDIATTLESICDDTLTGWDYVMKPSSTTLTCSWENKTGNLPEKKCSFQVKYRVFKERKGYRTIESTSCYVEITSLKPSTRYEVKVFWVDDNGDNHSMFGDEATTADSKSTFLKNSKMSFVNTSTLPHVYHLKQVNDPPPKTDKSKVRICDMISPYEQRWDRNEEKTFLLLGATGTGKSTFIDALINHLAEVNFTEDHRFKIIQKTEEEETREKNQADSQTSTTTVYRIPKLEGSTVKHKVNIIDTPGFNDTRENFDKKITDQIYHLFESHIEHLDAILIVLPMSVNRLTTGQKHVFTKIFEIFGKEIEQNIFIVFTHDDGGSVDGCMKVVSQAGIKYNNGHPCFRFNNSNVFSSNTHDDIDRDCKIWETRRQSFSHIFEVLKWVPRTTVRSSIDLMKSRTILELQLRGLENEIQSKARDIIGILSIKAEVKNQKKSVDEKQHLFLTEEPVKYDRVYTGTISINCPKHKRSCHHGCWVPLDRFIYKCFIFQNEKCQICECGLKEHVREPYRYDENQKNRMNMKEMVESHQDAKNKLEVAMTLSLQLEKKFERSIFELEKKLMQMKDTMKSITATALVKPQRDEIKTHMRKLLERTECESKEFILLSKCLDYIEDDISLSTKTNELLSI